MDSETIDRDPIALLPAGGIVVTYLDGHALFLSSLGAEFSHFVSALVPLGPESNFVPSRDLAKVFGAVYAFQGSDVCAVVQGNFDIDAIQRAADGHAMTPFGAPMVRSRYAERDVFTVSNVGFVPITSHTALVGSENGMRRALDRLRFGKLERSIPAEMTELLSTQGAAIAAMADLRGQPIPPELAQQAAFVSGLKAVRVIGNLQPPGINIAGSITYADAASAQNAAGALMGLKQMTQVLAMFQSAGFGRLISGLQVSAQGGDVAFTLPTDDSILRMLLKAGGESMMAARKPATVTHR